MEGLRLWLAFLSGVRKDLQVVYGSILAAMWAAYIETSLDARWPNAAPAFQRLFEWKVLRMRDQFTRWGIDPEEMVRLQKEATKGFI